jgi:hypothetical protein
MDINWISILSMVERGNSNDRSSRSGIRLKSYRSYVILDLSVIFREKIQLNIH